MQTIKRTSAKPEFGRGLSKKPERVTRQTPHSIPILTHYPRNYKRKHRKIRIRLRPTPFSIMLAIGALYCMTPLLEKAICCIGTIPSVGILAGIAVIVGITI